MQQLILKLPVDHHLTEVHEVLSSNHTNDDLAEKHGMYDKLFKKANTTSRSSVIYMKI